MGALASVAAVYWRTARHSTSPRSLLLTHNLTHSSGLLIPALLSLTCLDTHQIPTHMADFTDRSPRTCSCRVVFNRHDVHDYGFPT